MLQAELARMRSNCISRRVGAVIAKDRRQLAMGYNGTPSGIPNCYAGGCERCSRRMRGLVASGEDLDRCMCTHAEANAILHCTIMGINSVHGATLYSTDYPCLDCSKMAITIGVRRFVVMHDYPEDTQDLIRSANVQVDRIDYKRIAFWINALSSSMENVG